MLLEIASGATATVYIGRPAGSEGTSQLVAIKRAHAHLTNDLAARRALLEEARVAARIHHPNVAAVHDVDETDEDLLLIMDYVEGASLAELIDVSPGKPLPPRVAARIALDTCAGLLGVHELAGDDGQPLGLVHRDVSPQNVLVGVDGTARLADFGLAKLAESFNATRTAGPMQGKLAYLAPEYVNGAPFDAGCEVFALGVVVWETFAGRRLFRGANDADTLRRVLRTPAPSLTQAAPSVSQLAAVVAKALEKQPSRRHESVRAFSSALEAIARRHKCIGTSSEVGACVRAMVGANLGRRRALLRVAASAPPTRAPSDPSLLVTQEMVRVRAPIDLPESSDATEMADALEELALPSYSIAELPAAAMAAPTEADEDAPTVAGFWEWEAAGSEEAPPWNDDQDPTNFEGMEEALTLSLDSAPAIDVEAWPMPAPAPRARAPRGPAPRAPAPRPHSFPALLASFTTERDSTPVSASASVPAPVSVAASASAWIPSPSAPPAPGRRSGAVLIAVASVIVAGGLGAAIWRVTRPPSPEDAAPPSSARAASAAPRRAALTSGAVTSGAAAPQRSARTHVDPSTIAPSSARKRSPPPPASRGSPAETAAVAAPPPNPYNKR